MARVLVLGAGPMGLAAAHHALGLGHEVDLIEADRVLGGMAAHFDFGGLSIERFYHFVCMSDHPTFELMQELGIGDAMRWVGTRMGYYMEGRVHPWGDPVSLLRFPHLSLWSKIRTGLQMFLTTRARDFSRIEGMTTRQWIEGGSGPAVYRRMWERLMALKFHELADEVSASWIATRVKRIGRSRKSIFQEQLGYIEGGSQTLVDAMERAIRERGGRIHLGMPGERVLTRDGRVTGLRAGGQDFAADAVISTVPLPLIPALVPDLPEETRAAYARLRNIGVVCVILKLKRSVTRNFWVNIVDPKIEVPGIIEFSNLRPTGDAIVYVPYYMPVTHPKWAWSDDELIAEAFAAVRSVNPEITEADLIDSRAGRLRHAQPVCEPNFLDRLPPFRSPIEGLFIADTSHYYPEDRGVAESIRFGRMMAEQVAR
ncbi:NAD(P)/FAD-dependent oxidoreductase [Roseococcus sp. YIM B11640]|uniref:NAD(P)/FAD-dependent oxidoreductase n=1 Tax=Roseococcus sp. YIM B11640 TaxID=3133973 RepID=UPI003C7ED836